MGNDFQDALLKQGATDFYFTSVQMKKGRPGLKLSVLVSNEHLQNVQEFILENTSTIGLRFFPVDRKILQRRELEIDTKYGKIKAKEVITPSGQKRHKIDYESIAELSRKHNISAQQLKSELYHILATLVY